MSHANAEIPPDYVTCHLNVDHRWCVQMVVPECKLDPYPHVVSYIERCGRRVMRCASCAVPSCAAQALEAVHECCFLVSPTAGAPVA